MRRWNDQRAGVGPVCIGRYSKTQIPFGNDNKKNEGKNKLTTTENRY